VSEPLAVGIAGYGLAGEVFHAPLVAAEPGLRVAGIVTRDPERQARAHAAHPGAAIVDDAAKLEDIDLLVVATPNRAHVPLALAAIERGIAVVVDKPLAPSAADARPLIARGGRLTVFQNRRYDGDFLTVRRLVDDGELGEVVRFESRFDRFRPAIKPGAWRELADPDDGGGLLLDLGPHLVDQAILLLGPVARVYAEVDIRRPGAQVDDDTFVALEHRGGARSHLWMSATAPLHGPRFRVSGLQAGVEIAELDPQEAQLAGGTRPGEPGWGETRDRFATVADADGRREVPIAPGAYERFYAEVAAWLRDEGPAPVDPADSLALLEILDAARASAATATTIEMEKT
jgi:predicted dehydrogenase